MSNDSPLSRRGEMFRRALEIVSDVFQIERAIVLGKSRHATNVLARQTIHYLLYRAGYGSLKMVGRRVGDRDHSTVIHSMKAIERILEIRDVKEVVLVEETIDRFVQEFGFVTTKEEVAA